VFKCLHILLTGYAVWVDVTVTSMAYANSIFLFLTESDRMRQNACTSLVEKMDITHSLGETPAYKTQCARCTQTGGNANNPNSGKLMIELNWIREKSNGGICEYGDETRSPLQ
jgi:hypothetical protein